MAIEVPRSKYSTARDQFLRPVSRYPRLVRVLAASGWSAPKAFVVLSKSRLYSASAAVEFPPSAIDAGEVIETYAHSWMVRAQHFFTDC